MASNIFPIDGKYKITSFFGFRKAPTLGASSNHIGIDISVPKGTPVLSSISGTVKSTVYNKARGNVVTIEGNDGTSTIYQHLSAFNVKPGQKVKQGQKIALSGDTGVSTGPHLHYEVLKNGINIDPLEFHGASPGSAAISSIKEQTGSVMDILKKYWWAAALGLVVLAITK